MKKKFAAYIRYSDVEQGPKALDKQTKTVGIWAAGKGLKTPVSFFDSSGAAVETRSRHGRNGSK